MNPLTISAYIRRNCQWNCLLTTKGRCKPASPLYSIEYIKVDSINSHRTLTASLPDAPDNKHAER